MIGSCLFWKIPRFIWQVQWLVFKHLQVAHFFHHSHFHHIAQIHSTESCSCCVSWNSWNYPDVINESSRVHSQCFYTGRLHTTLSGSYLSSWRDDSTFWNDCRILAIIINLALGFSISFSLIIIIWVILFAIHGSVMDSTVWMKKSFKS